MLSTKSGFEASEAGAEVGLATVDDVAQAPATNATEESAAARTKEVRWSVFIELSWRDVTVQVRRKYTVHAWMSLSLENHCENR